MAESAALIPPGEFAPVSLSVLRVSPSFREGGLHQDHVERLVGLRGDWPPILVGRSDGVVIDGVHRVAAAHALGLECIDAMFFEGGPDDALIEFVRRNVNQGLPLTLGERKRAAGRVLLAHPEWSDRRIAELCAISPKTMGRLRRKSGSRASGPVPHVGTESRIGRDNKSRPVNSALLRRRVVEAIEEQPGAPLRAIAASVGVSPETVRRVHMQMRASASRAAEPSSPRGSLTLPSRECEKSFFAWFDRTSVGETDCSRRARTVPSGHIHKVAEEARRRSEVWLQFAQHLEERRQGKRRE